MEIITSLKNEKIQEARELGSLKGRKSSGKLLLEGEEIISWAAGSGIDIDYIITSMDKPVGIPGISPGTPAYKTSEGLMKKITGTNYLVPVIAVGQHGIIQPKDDFMIVLDGVKDFGNIGTIVRTAQAFGINRIISTKIDFDLFQRKTIEASRGTVFKTRLDCFESPGAALKHLRDNGYQIIATSPRGSKIQSLMELRQSPIALVIGNESSGASEELLNNADFTVQIPMSENIESLNVGVSAGISVYELRLKQVIAMIEQKIKSTLGREVNVASMLIRAALDSALKKVSSISSDQLVFMMVLKCDREMQKTGIQRQFGIPDIDYESFIGPLAENAYIKEISAGKYSITEKGIEILGKLWPVVENTENKIFSGFTDKEKSSFFDMINRIRDNCVKLD